MHEEHHSSWFIVLLKLAEVLGETNDFVASTVQRKLALSIILENKWCFNQIKYSQGKLALDNFKITTRLWDIPNSKQTKTSPGEFTNKCP